MVATQHRAQTSEGRFRTLSRTLPVWQLPAHSIGLAGGLNLYGFASGDPVNFSDPFGLCKDKNGREIHSYLCDKGIGLEKASTLYVSPNSVLPAGGCVVPPLRV